MSDKKKPFNDAFAGLAKVKVQSEPAKAPPPPPPAAKAAPKDDGADAFLKAMQGVKPMQPDLRGDVQRPQAERPSEVEALIDLASSLDADRELSGDEPVREAAAKSLDKKILKQLRAGDIAFASSLDLHGMRREQAEQALEKFLLAALREKQRCVLVITGRGAHSEDGTPVLKGTVSDALRRGRLVRHVLAYTEAHVKHGGAGAYYVLLRRK